VPKPFCYLLLINVSITGVILQNIPAQEQCYVPAVWVLPLTAGWIEFQAKVRHTHKYAKKHNLSMNKMGKLAVTVTNQAVMDCPKVSTCS
jgi:hypothetical protein